MNGLRAYDLFMAARGFAFRPVHPTSLTDLQTVVRTATRFVVTPEVVDCFRHTVESQGGLMRANELPPCAVPFSSFWMDWAPSPGDEASLTESGEGVVIRYGALCVCSAEKLYLYPFVCGLLKATYRVIVDPGISFFSMDLEDGTLNGEGAALPFGDTTSSMEKFPHFALGLVHFTLALLGATNVQRQLALLPRAIRRNPGLFEKTATDSHYILNVPGAQQLRAAVVKGDFSNLKRLHIVRGHFADYTEGGGLFGKLHGKYYIAPHVRGNAALGTITKDYRILAGAHADSP